MQKLWICCTLEESPALLNNGLFNDYRLEKEYTTIKNKEMEEQIEIKVRKNIRNAKTLENLKLNYGKCSFLLFKQRLRTENRLLKQRIETLEKVRAFVCLFEP